MVGLPEGGRSARSLPAVAPSPPTDRVIAVLELLSDRPEQALTPRDIARALGMSKATCHAVNACLAKADYLIRNPADKTFTLGPALVAAGRAAEHAYPAVRLAQVEAAAIADEFDLHATAAIRSEEHLVIVAQAGPGPKDMAARIGRRIPLAPPFGGVFVAWSGWAAIENWLTRTEGTSSREPLLDSLAAIRARGYSVERLAPAMVRLRHTLAAVNDDPLAAGIRSRVVSLLAELHQAEYLPGDLTGRGRRSVSALSAPVFDAHRQTQMNLSVQPHRDLAVPGHRTTRQTSSHAGARVTHAVGGMPPEGFPRMAVPR
jgi:DNA-binding IclR family transcriptional regulator